MKYILVIALLFSLFSCDDPVIEETVEEEEMLACEANCYQIDLSGTMMNESTQEGEPNLTVVLQWCNTNVKYFGDIYHIEVVQTDENGYFSFTNLIDTTLFSEDFYLNVSTPQRSDRYVVDTEFNTNSILGTTYHALNFSCYDFAELELNLMRTLPDTTFVTPEDSTVTVMADSIPVDSTVIVPEDSTVIAPEDSIVLDSIESLFVEAYFSNQYYAKNIVFTETFERNDDGELDIDSLYNTSFTTVAGVDIVINLITTIYGEEYQQLDTIVCDTEEENSISLTY